MQGKMIDVGGVSTYCFDEGSGRPVVLLHGASLGIDAITTWQSLISALSPAFRVVAFDQIGFGGTDRPSDNRYLNRLERVHHAIGVLESLGISDACLIGHSEGAFMAARIAIVRPDLAKQIAVVASGGLAPGLGDGADDGWVEASRLAYTYGSEVETEDGFIEVNRRLTFRRSDTLEAHLRANYQRPELAQQLAMFRSIERSADYPEDYLSLQHKYIYPFTDKLPRTLLVWGADDATVPVERAVALMQKIPGSDLHVFSNCAHMVMYDRAQAFNDLIGHWCSAQPC